MVATPSENKSIYILLFQHVSQLPQRSGNKCGNYTTSEQDAVIIRALWCALGLTCFFFLKSGGLFSVVKKKKKKKTYIEKYRSIHEIIYRVILLPYCRMIPSITITRVYSNSHTRKKEGKMIQRGGNCILPSSIVQAQSHRRAFSHRTISHLIDDVFLLSRNADVMSRVRSCQMKAGEA